MCVCVHMCAHIVPVVCSCCGDTTDLGLFHEFMASRAWAVGTCLWAQRRALEARARGAEAVGGSVLGVAGARDLSE